MRNIVITISRQYGSGGKTIGAMLAKELGINCYSREILRMASEDSGINEKLFGMSDEKVRRAGWFKLLSRPYEGGLIPPEDREFTSDDNLFNYQAKVIKELAAKESCVIVGRCADYVLKDYSNNSFKTLISNVYIPPFSGVDLEQVCTSISSLKRLGIIEIVTDIFLADASLYEPFKETSDYQALSVYAASFRDSKKLETKNYLGYLTPLGENFYEVCVK